MNAAQIIKKYTEFFEKKSHKRIPNSPLVPENDPTTLFTSSGMQPLVNYLLGEIHPQGSRLVNVQNCFRAQDIEEIGDNRHTTFFRMLGNWSLGDYFKKEQLPWFFEFLTKELGIPAKKLYVSVFNGYNNIAKDKDSTLIWKGLFENAGITSKNRIFYYGIDKNWWSRSGTPKNMPEGEPGGPDSEVFFDFGEELKLHENSSYKNQPCHINCDCGRYLEIGNSVFMQYIKQKKGFSELSQKNVDFGGGVERLIAAAENKSDIFQTSIFAPIIKSIEQITNHSYCEYARQMRIIRDHFVSAAFITLANVIPSNKEQGYILRRLIRRGLDNFYELKGSNLPKLLETIVDQYKDTDPLLSDKFEEIKYIILQEEQTYKIAFEKAKKFIIKKYKREGDEILGNVMEISSDDAFMLYSTHGLSPTQIKSLGYNFNEQEFAEKVKKHQKVSRAGAEQKFKGGLADESKKTIMGHTATHLIHQALKDLLGENVKQIGSNITSERIRFDFNYDKKLTDEETRKLEKTINEKINENLPVYYDIMPINEAKKVGAIGLFDEKYQNEVKVYCVGKYSKEICGGPHIKNTKEIKNFSIIKQENIGKGQRRIYAKVG